RTGDLPTVEGGGRLFDEIPRENIPPVLRDRLSPNYAPVPADMAQAAFEAGQPGVRINNVIDDNVDTFDLTQRTPTDTVQRWPTNGRPETGYRSRFAMFDPARAGRSDIMAVVVPATVALGGAVAGAAALAPQDAEAATPGTALARALARQAPRFNQALDTSLDVASFFDPSMGYATETARALKDLPGKVGPAGAVALAPLTGATEALASVGQLPELMVAGGRALARALARAPQPRGSQTYRKAR
ncbi:MAG: hypothetical protein KGS44_16645, partial [Alphaproteobacteria bacterium]|nr:hypothetical protein [Alphaproteobacteria bacterium]